MKEIDTINKTQVKEMLDDIWEMSKALYHPDIEDCDISFSNYKALGKINSYCARNINKLVGEYEKKNTNRLC